MKLQAFTNLEKIPTASYTPAETWDGLVQVGGKVEEKETVFFVGFPPQKKASNSTQITAAVQRAVVEVYTLHQAGRPLEFQDWLPTEELLKDVTTEVQFVKTRAGGVIKYGKEQTKANILEALTVKEKAWSLDNEYELNAAKSADALADNQQAQNERDKYLKQKIASWDPTWLSVSLKDGNIKFAVLKRTLQLTGIHLHDAEINNVTDVKSLLTRLAIKPKPRKLAELFEKTHQLDALPNVTFSPKRVTMVEKETKLGRWKIIQRELERRNLPVFGVPDIIGREEPPGPDWLPRVVQPWESEGLEDEGDVEEVEEAEQVEETSRWPSLLKPK